MVFSEETETENFAWKFVSGVISFDDFPLHISVDVVYFMNMEDVCQKGNASSIQILLFFMSRAFFHYQPSCLDFTRCKAKISTRGSEAG